MTLSYDQGRLNSRLNNGLLPLERHVPGKGGVICLTISLPSRGGEDFRQKKAGLSAGFCSRAGKGIRTLDPHLGKVVFYH